MPIVLTSLKYKQGKIWKKKKEKGHVSLKQ